MDAKIILLVLFLSGCTVVIWSDNVTVDQKVDPGDDAINVPKRLKNVTNQ